MSKSPYRYHVLPCAGPTCGPETGERFRGLLKDLCPDRKDLGVRISSTSCQGMCKQGPNLAVYPEGLIYHGVGEADLARIVEEHFRQGRPVEELLAREPAPREEPGDK
jgi:(2Fe-2S) ferredoxin